MKNKYKEFMQQAIDEAWKYQFLTYPNPAVGACIVKDDKVLSVEAHHEAGMAHAEVNALKSAFLTAHPNSELKSLTTSLDIHNFLISNHNNFFIDKEIYITLEPCNHIGKTPACTSLLKSINIKKVYIGTLDPNKKATGGLKILQDANIDVEIDILKDRCEDLIYPFIKWQDYRFRFFKLAMRKNGTITGGYITTQDSLNLVHEIRTKLDLLVIGGNTVRIDAPTLDARFAKINKPSNILIYSKCNEFCNTIPLFNIQDRTVTISSDINTQSEKFIMFEGGYNLLDVVKDDIDMLMLFVSHKEDDISDPIDTESLGFRKIYSYFINESDEILFLRRDMSI